MAGVFNGRPPLYHGETVEGYCGLCNLAGPVTLRQWFYFHTLPRRDLALRFLSGGAPWWGRPMLAALYPKIRAIMVERMEMSYQDMQVLRV